MATRSSNSHHSVTWFRNYIAVTTKYSNFYPLVAFTIRPHALMKLYVSGFRPHQSWELFRKNIIVLRMLDLDRRWVETRWWYWMPPFISIDRECLVSNSWRRIHRQIRVRVHFSHECAARHCCMPFKFYYLVPCKWQYMLQNGTSKFTT